MDENKGKQKKIIGIYFLFVILYGIFVSFFSSTVHTGADEEIYLSMAKSFHYEGNFQVANLLVNYKCVLYSVIISVAYYLYSPEYILLVMRLINVFIMCSAIFPMYLLALAILKNEQHARKFSVIMMFMPCMMNCAYIMQEVLCYPLFLWFLYLLYKYVERKSEEKMPVIILMGLALLSVLCFLTKTYMMFVPVALNLWWIYQCVSTRRIGKNIRDMLFYSGSYLFFMLLGYGSIYVINGFQNGVNHYDRQIMLLFPVTINTVLTGVADSLVYMAFFLLTVGIFPICGMLLYCKQKEIENQEMRKFVTFCLIAILVTIEETIVLIVLTEDGVGTLPRKFLFRYLQIFIPPVFLLFQKMKGQIELLVRKSGYVLLAVCILIADIYFFIMRGNTRQAIMDGYLYLNLENITKYIFPYSDMIGITIMGFGLGGAAYIFATQKVAGVKQISKIGIGLLLLFWLLNAIQLPIYTNIIAGGKQIQEDGIRIAHYLNENEIETVYFVDDKMTDSYVRNLYGYMQQGFFLLEPNSTIALDSAILIPKGSSQTIDAEYELQMEGKKILLYTSK